VTRILVVDDSPALRMLLVDALTDAGFEAVGAENGQAALALADRWHPDAIILDVMMPVMDGPTFMRARRERPDLAAVPVLVLTAQPSHDRLMQNLDATLVLRKPYDLDELLDAVESLAAGATGRGQVG
jgi:two-component system, OmpR family, response regulator MprA